MTRRELLKNFRSLAESSVDALLDILDVFPKQGCHSSPGIYFLPRLNNKHEIGFWEFSSRPYVLLASFMLGPGYLQKH